MQPRVVKAKAYNIYIAPHSAAAVALLCHRQSYLCSSRLSPRPRTLTCNQTVIRSLVCRLMVSTFLVHVITWITTHLPTPEGWETELAWLVDP